MADIHFHVWHYRRDPDGVIRSMERRPERYEKRRTANRALEMFRRQHCIAGQVLQCVDGAFCQPPPDWVVQGYTLGGAVEVGTEYFIDRTPSIRPSRKMELGMENLADYVQENPDLVVRRPSSLSEDRWWSLIPAAMKNWSRQQTEGPLIWQEPVGRDAGLTTTAVCPPAEAE